MSYFLDRIREESTWRGLLALATAVGVKLRPELQESIIAAGMAGIGLINVLRRGN